MYRKLMRMRTAMNRARAKGICEAVHTGRKNHECYQSHETWFLDMKYPMHKILKGMGLSREEVDSGEESDAQEGVGAEGVAASP